MSATVDERIVEMKFDNRDFEKGVEQTIKSIDNLKQNLKFDDTAKDSLTSLEQSINKVNFDGMNKAIDKINDKFSLMGMIATQQLLKIADQAISTGESLVKSLTIDQISAGWSKYETKLSSVQTIMAALQDSAEGTMENVNSQLEKLNWFTDETSYNFIDMTNTIGKFTSNGITLSDSITSIMGIATAAALAGANATSASHAMEGFSKTMASGTMTRINWSWIKTAKMDTKMFKEQLIEAAVALGTLNKTAEDTYETLEGNAVSYSDFESNLSDGWLTKDVLNKTLANYGTFANKLNEVCDETGLTASVMLGYIDDFMDGSLDMSAVAVETNKSVDDLNSVFTELSSSTYDVGRRAFKAAQEAKTFSDAINSVKDAASTGWMNTFEYIFGDYEESKSMWTDLANDLYDIFIPGIEARNELLGKWHKLDSGGYKDFIAGATGFFKGFINIINATRDALEQIFPKTTVEKLQAFTLKFKELGLKFQEITAYIAPVKEEVEATTEAISSSVDGVVATVQTAGEAIETVAKSVINGDYGNGQARITALTNLGYSFEAVQNKVNELMGCNYRYTVNESKVNKATGKLINTNTELVETQNDISESTSEAAEVLEETVASTEQADTMGQKLFNTLTGIFSIVGLVTDAIKALATVVVIPAITYVVPRVLNAILTVTSKIGVQITKIVKQIRESGAITKFLTTVVNKFLDIKDAISDAFSQAGNLESVQFLVDTFAKIPETIGQVAGDAGTALSGLFSTLDGVAKKIPFSSFLVSAFDGIAKVLGSVIKFISPFLESIKKVFGAFITYFGTLDWSFVTKKFSTISDSLKSFNDKISDLLTAYSKSGKSLKTVITKMKTNAKNGFVDLLDKFLPSLGIGKYFTKLTSIKKQYKSQKSFLSELAGDITNAEGPVDILQLVANKLKTALSTVLSTINKFFEPVTKALTPIASSFKSIFQGFIDAFSGVSLTDISNLIKAIAVFVGVYKFSKAAESAVGVFDSLSGIFKGIKKSIQIKAISTLLPAIGILIGAIAGSIWVLSTISSEALERSTKALAVMAICVIGMVYVMTNLAKLDAKSVGVAAGGLIAAGAAIALAASALTIVANVVQKGQNTWEQSLFVLGMLLVMLMGSVLLMTWISSMMVKNQMNFGEALGTAVIMYGFGAALKKMVEAFAEVSAMELENVEESLIKFGVIVAGLAILAAASSKLPKTAALNLVGLVGSIWLAMKVIEQLNEFPYEAIIAVIPKVLTIFAGLLLLAIAARVAGNGGMGLAATLVGLGISIKLMASAIKSLSDLRPEEIIAGTVALSALIGMMTIFALVAGLTTKTMNKDQKQSNLMATLIGFGICMILLAAAVRIVGTMSAADVAKGTIAISALIAMMTIMIKFTSGAEKAKVAIISVTVLVGLLVAALFILSVMPIEKTLAAAVGLTAVIVALAEMVKAITRQKIDVKTAIVTVATMALLLAGVTLALGYLMSVGDITKMLTAAISLSALLAVIALVSLAMAKIGLISNPATMANAVASMSIVFVAIVALLALLSTVPEDALDEAIKLSQKIGEFIGAFAGGLIGGLVGGTITTITNAIDELSDVIVKLSETMQIFSDGVKNVDDRSIEVGTQFAEMLSALAGAGLKQGLADILGSSSLETITEGLPEYATALCNFADSVSEISLSDLLSTQIAAKMSKSLCDVLDNVPRKGGWIQSLIGEVSWSNLSDGLYSYGMTLISFGSQMQILCKNKDAVAGIYEAVDISKAFCEVLNALPQQKDIDLGNGFLKYSEGGQSWSTLADGLKDYGEAINSFADSVKDFNDKTEETIGRAITISYKFADLLKALPQDESVSYVFGLYSKSSGTSYDWESLSQGLHTFASAMSDFIGYFRDYETKDIVKASGVLKSITDVFATITSASLTSQQFTMYGSFLTGLNDYLVPVAKPIKDFVSEMKEIDLSLVNKATDILRKLITTFDGISVSASDLTTYSAALVAFSEDAKTTFANLSSLVTSTNSESGFTNLLGSGTDDANNGVGLIQQLINDIDAMGQQLMNMDLTQFQQFGTKLVTTISSGMKMTSSASAVVGTEESMASSLISAINSLLDDMKQTIALRCSDKNDILAKGEQITTTLSNGISAYTALKKVAESASKVIDKFVEKIESLSQKYYDAGKNVTLGFANGMKDNDALVAVAKAAADVAQTALDTIKNTTDEHSPSKATEEMGVFLDLGLANGIDKAISSVTDSATNLGATAVDSVQGMLNGFDLGTTGIAAAITPVMDLSNVRSSSAQLGAMMSRNQALSASASFNLNAQNDDIATLVKIGSQLLKSVQNGSDLYLDERVLVGRINRRLGQL